MSNSLRSFLKTMIEMRRRMYGNSADAPKYACPEDVVLQHGIVPRAKLPSPWIGEPKQCFYNSAILASSYVQDGFYTEGYFLSVIPVHHAWVTLPDGSIHDPTINDDRGPEHYIGVPFTRKFFAKHLRRRNDYPSVFTDGRTDMYDLDVLNGDFEVAKIERIDA